MRYILYGSGTIYEKYKLGLQSYDIIAHLDKKSIDELERLEYDYIVICTDKYYAEIRSELTERRLVNPAKILSYRQLVGLKSPSPQCLEYLSEELSKYDRNSVKVATTFKNGLGARYMLNLEEEINSYSVWIGSIEELVNDGINDKFIWVPIGHESKTTKTRMKLLKVFSCGKLYYMNMSKSLRIDEEKIIVYVVCHKNEELNTSGIFQPLYVGKAVGYRPEYSEIKGENISYLNPYLNEYTALYWMWKNATSEYIGLNHYRRYFYKSEEISLENRIDAEIVLGVMKNYDIILPKYEIVGSSVGDNIRSVIGEELYSRIYKEMKKMMVPSEIKALNVVHSGCGFYSRGMFITSRKILDRYCNWVFPILLELTKRIDMSEISGSAQRAIGYFAETMWNVWLMNQKLRIKELPFTKD